MDLIDFLVNEFRSDSLRFCDNLVMLLYFLYVKVLNKVLSGQQSIALRQTHQTPQGLTPTHAARTNRIKCTPGRGYSPWSVTKWIRAGDQKVTLWFEFKRQLAKVCTIWCQTPPQGGLSLSLWQPKDLLYQSLLGFFFCVHLSDTVHWLQPPSMTGVATGKSASQCKQQQKINGETLMCVPGRYERAYFFSIYI